MEWFELLKQAEESDFAKDLSQAEICYSQAVEYAQTRFGPWDVNVAKCLLAFAQFLEAHERFEDALLRYKLASAIYKKVGHSSAHQLAAGKVMRMEALTHKPGEAQSF